MSGLGHGEKMTRRQTAAIMALLTESTIGQAAKKAGVGEATLGRWLQQPEFAKQYRDARARILDGAISRLTQIAMDAVTTLHAVAKSKSASPSSRVSAARAILETALRAAEIEQIRSRIDALESALNEQRGEQ